MITYERERKKERKKGRESRPDEDPVKLSSAFDGTAKSGSTASGFLHDVTDQ